MSVITPIIIPIDEFRREMATLEFFPDRESAAEKRRAIERTIRFYKRLYDRLDEIQREIQTTI